MLKSLRKKFFQNKEIDKILGNFWDKYYVEKSYQKNKLFTFLIALRKKGADINEFLDKHINEDEK